MWVDIMKSLIAGLLFTLVGCTTSVSQNSQTLSDEDLCHLATECADHTTFPSCSADPNCDWGPVAQPGVSTPGSGSGSGGGSGSNAEPGACGLIDPCPALANDECNANPRCELLAVDDPCEEQPAGSGSGSGSGCGGTPTNICISRGFECGGGSGSGDGSGSSGSGSAGSGSGSH